MSIQRVAEWTQSNVMGSSLGGLKLSRASTMVFTFFSIAVHISPTHLHAATLCPRPSRTAFAVRLC